MWFLYSKFKAKKWKKYTPEKRFVILRELEKRVAKKLDIEPLYLEIKEGGEDWNCFGSFTVYNNTKKIILNPMLIYEPKYRFHAMETIAHETRHAYQFSVANRKLKWYEFKAKKWQRNWSGYFSSGIDNLMYNNQSIERDAQKFSIKFLKKHSGKYSNDLDFQNTLDAVEYRYNQADLDARKKYGFFYKHKIEQNIINNSKY